MASTAQYLSMSFGIALASLLMEAFLGGHEPAQYVHAFRCSILILAALTLGASWIFSRLRRDRPVIARTTDESTAV
jgi:hypothetical protein